MDLISVIVPVYNVEKYLKRCVESIQKQTYSNLEIILVDDGTPDNCGMICDELSRQDNRIKVIHKDNGGLGFARNSGLDVATGSYVTFIDSDDWISDVHIENLYAALKENDGDMAIGGHTLVNVNGEHKIYTGSLMKVIYEKKDILEEIMLPLIGPDTDYKNDIQINASACMNLYNLELIKQHNLRFISERFAISEDTFFNLDFFYRAKKVVVTKEAGYFYFENIESTSRKYTPERFERTINYYKKMQERVHEYGLKDRISFRLDRSYLTKIRIAIRHITCSELKRKNKIREIQKILEHQLTKSVLNNYPVHTYMPAMRLLVKMMAKQNSVGVYYITKLRESAKHQPMLRKMLNAVGIRR